MPLQKQPLAVPLATGIDTKTDAKLIMPAKLQRLENGVFTKLGALSKRNGSAALPGFDWDRSASGDFKGSLATYDDELLAAGGGLVQAYGKTARRWYSKGTLHSAAVRSAGIYADQYEQSFPTCATANGITLHAFESTAGGLWATVVDEQTGTRLVSQVQVDRGGSKPVAVACGNRLHLFFLHDSGGGSYSIHYTRISTAQPTNFMVPVELVAEANFSSTEPYFSVKPFADQMALLYVDNNDALVLAYVTRAGGIGGPPDGLPSPVTIAGPREDMTALNLALVGDDIWPIWAESTQLFAAAYGAAFNVTSAWGAVGAVQARTVVNLTGCADELLGLRLYFEMAPASGDPAYNTVVRTCHVSYGGAVTGLGDFKRGVGLAAEAFVQDGLALVGVVYDSPTQSTLFVLDPDGVVVAKALAGRAGGLTGYPRLPTISQVSPGRWILSVGSKQAEETAPGEVFRTPKGITKVSLDFSAERFRSAQLGENQHLVGGVVTGYDGVRLFEAGFHLAPESPKAIRGMEFDLVVTSKADGPQTLYITPPADITGPNGVKSGARIRAGSYIVLGQQTVTGTPTSEIYLWFRIDGVGSAPFPGTIGTQLSCDISAQDDQATVAFKIKGALSTNSARSLLTASVPTGTNQVKVVDKDPAGDSHRTEKITPYPVLDTQFGIQTIWIYTATPTPKVVQLVCCAGQYIQSGQWFALSSSYVNGTTITNPQRVCFYFVVDGHAPAVLPAPNDCDHVSAINIASTDTPLQVHTAVKNALNAFTVSGTAIFAATANATDPFIRVEPVASPSPPNYTDIPDPVNYNVGGSLSTPSATAGAVRQYVAVYTWTDAQGQLHRSVPSLPLQMYTGATQADPDNPTPLTRATNVVSVSTLRVTRRPHQSVTIELYRTEANGTIHYRVATTPNDATVDSVTFVDTVSDVDALSAAPLYTDGGELDDDGPPPSTIIALHRNRLFLAGMEDPYQIWFSKQFVPNSVMGSPGWAVEFSSFQTIQVNPAGGEITALATMDEKLIIFQRNRVSYVLGEGPDATGQGTPVSGDQDP